MDEVPRVQRLLILFAHHHYLSLSFKFLPLYYFLCLHFFCFAYISNRAVFVSLFPPLFSFVFIHIIFHF